MALLPLLWSSCSALSPGSSPTLGATWKCFLCGVSQPTDHVPHHSSPVTCSPAQLRYSGDFASADRLSTGLGQSKRILRAPDPFRLWDSEYGDDHRVTGYSIFSLYSCHLSIQLHYCGSVLQICALGTGSLLSHGMRFGVMRR